MIAKTFSKSLCATACAAVLLRTPAVSATLKNLDKSAHRIVVVEGDLRKEHTIASQQELKGVCVNACSVYVGEDPDPYELAAADKVQIQDGELHYFEEKAPAN